MWFSNQSILLINLINHILFFIKFENTIKFIYIIYFIMRLRKQSANRRTIIYLILIIFLLTYTILSTIGKKSSDNIIEVSNTLINDLIIDIVNSSIKNDILKQNNINNLIEFNYNSQKEIESINYNI